MSVKIGSLLWTIKSPIPSNTLIIGADVFHERGKDSVPALSSKFGPNLEYHFSNFRRV